MSARKKPSTPATGRTSGAAAKARNASARTATKPAAGRKTAAAKASPPAEAPGGGRLSVPKTYKLFIGGKFPRSESGRSYEVRTGDGRDFLANASLASRKDVRDAVGAARKAFGGWSKATAYNRGQVLYRIAEMLDARRDEFAAELRDAGATAEAAMAEVDAAVDTWVHYAGFSDKYAQLIGSANPVAAPYFNFSLPEPTGVVAVLVPDAGQPLQSLAATIAPVIVSGNTCVVVAPEHAPLPSISFAEVLATSDVPGGVVNVLTGRQAELAPVLASHMDVNAIDLAGAADDVATDLEVRAADNLKRVVRPRDLGAESGRGLGAIERFIELKTVWHPVGV